MYSPKACPATAPHSHCPLGLARFGTGRTCWTCPELLHPSTSGPVKSLGQRACPDWFSVSLRGRVPPFQHGVE